MKLIIASILTVFISFNSPIDELRVSFGEARKNEKLATEFYELVSNTTFSDSNMKLAYVGAAEIILAKYKESISDRISWVKRGKDNLEKAIADQPDNLEARILRFMIQNNTPAIIRYKGSLDEDKRFILQNFKRGTPGQKLFLTKAAKETSYFTEEEAAILK